MINNRQTYNNSFKKFKKKIMGEKLQQFQQNRKGLLCGFQTFNIWPSV